MSADENTILSAYMDDELDADQRRLIESAVAADAGLAEELRALAVVHDLVAGLPREAPVEICAPVMQRILARQNGEEKATAPVSPGWRPRVVLSLVGWLSAAAALLIATTIALVQGGRVPALVRGARRAHEASIATDTSTPRSSAPSVVTADRGSSVEPSSSRSDGVSASRLGPVAHDSTGVVATASVPPDSDLLDVRRLLDHPSLRTFFYVRNGQDGQTEQRVASVVERTVRRGYFKMTISQGIVIDPRHPDEATVFPLVVKPDELDKLRGQLKVAFAEQVEEVSADPRVVTQLADIGSVHVTRQAVPGVVSISREGLALQLPNHGPAENNGPPSPARTPTREQFRSAPVPPPGGLTATTDHHPGDGHDATRAAESIVVVWVYTPRADEPSDR
jgi:anti-sigma factor RsiW